MNPLIHLPELYRHRACLPGWRTLIKGLGVGRRRKGIYVSLGDIATTNGADDAYWYIRCLNWSQVDIRRAVISGALLPTVKRASAYTDDARVHDCIAAVERWCAGDHSVDLVAADWAAWVASRAAANAAQAAGAAAGAAGLAARAAWFAARAAVGAALDAAEAADAALAAAGSAENAGLVAERERQRQDIIAAFPPVFLKTEGENV